MPSLPLAETASIYGEEVTFREMVSQLEPEDKLAKIVEKIDAVVNSTVRQVHFDQTEAQLHEVRAQGEITADDITSAFHSTMHEMYGGEDSPFDDLESNTGNLLNYVPHLLAVRGLRWQCLESFAI
jgi:oligoendopeptidase F